MAKQIVILIGLCMGVLQAQDSLCVFKLGGEAYLNKSKKLKSLVKGDFIPFSAQVILGPQSQLVAIDQEGNAYKVNQAKTYTFNNLLKFKAKGGESLTSKYLKFVWNELVNEKKRKTIIGGVFRGEVLMQYPIDSARLASNGITLKWQTVETNNRYYVFIENTTTKDLLKLATNGSEISLFRDQAIFSEGTQFRWAVTTKAFPNLKNLPFYHFSLIDKTDYQQIKANSYATLVKDLSALGLEDLDIENTLCEVYGLCK